MSDDLTDSITIRELMALGTPAELAILIVDTIQDSVVEALQTLPDSDAGLATGDLFWNGGFLCKKL